MKFNKIKKTISQVRERFIQPTEPKKETDLSEWKQKALEDFRQWLDQVDENIIEDLQETEDEGDILELIGEMTALRQEVKIMSRSSGKLLGAVEEVASTVTDTVAPLADELRSYDRNSRTTNERNILRPLLLDFGDFMESLNEALAQTSETNWKWYIPQRVRDKASNEKHNLILKALKVRCDSILLRYDVKSIAHLNDPFDAVTMTAVDTSEDGTVSAGQVSSVIKQGFSAAGEILRTAHVIIEKE